MKFCNTLIAREIPEAIKRTLEEQPARSGMYNWIFAHKGSIETFWDLKDHIEDYDVIQVNMSPKDMPLIPELRNLLKGSSTKLVINNDYVCEYWGKFEIDPLYYEQIQKMGDMVFSTEEHQVSNMVNGTFTIPHPTNTKPLKHLGGNPKENSIGFIFHWWNHHTYLPGTTMNRMKKKFGLDTTKIYGYFKQWDEMKKWNGVLFDKIVPLMPFPKFAELIQAERAVYDPCSYHTYGRNGVELACFGVPVVGSNRVFSYKKLFPELSIDPFNRNDAMKKMDLALNGDIDDILKNAYDAVEFFNYKNSVKRFNEALEICEDRGNYKWYQKNG